MENEVINHYLDFSVYTNPGRYRDALKSDLPDDVREIGNLVRSQIIHRTTLEWGNVGSNADLRFGDMGKVPWHRQPEDDVLVTASAMLSELYRRDCRGFVRDRAEKDKLVLTCRFVSVMMASILKSKGVPCRVRSGNASYFDMGTLGKVSTDHWINQYWDSEKWVTIDVDGSWSLAEDFDPYSMPQGKFDFPARAWLDIRSGNDDPDRFWNAGGERGQMVVAWSLFYDFHSLMNDEVIYPHIPDFVRMNNFPSISQSSLEEIDDLARLMLEADRNFHRLKEIWDTNRKFRLLKGALL